MVTGSSKAWLGGFGEIANFQSVSDGKALVASAITDKGVQTASDATFQTMANNIRNIESLDFDVFNRTFISSYKGDGPASTDYGKRTYSCNIPSGTVFIDIIAYIRGIANNPSASIIIPLNMFSASDTYYVFLSTGNLYGFYRLPTRDTDIANYQSKFWIEGNKFYFTAALTPNGYSCSFYK